jgi:nicotinamide-nucleotide amidase
LKPRTSVLVTGSELIRGSRRDSNGPFLAEELTRLGLEPSSIRIVGDDQADLEPAIREGLKADLLVLSGGLGPTHDDRTVELLARAAGLEASVVPELEREIEGVSRRIAERLGRPYAEFEEGVRKQATVPAGGRVIGIAGTAPGLVVQTSGAVAVVLPGPPPELRRLWQAALEDEAVRGVLARAEAPERRVLRVYGVSESAIARALVEAGGEPEGVQATICAHAGEIRVELFGDGEELAESFRGALGAAIFSEDDRPVEELVLDLARECELTLGAAESCTGGLVAARLTSVPGSSDVFTGGVVAYANAVKEEELGVPAALLAEHGAVSAETAAAMAAGVRRRLGVDVGVSVTGIAGPDGGTPGKPVGLVYVHAETPDETHGIEFSFPSDRETIRVRATVAALHLVRRLLSQERDSHA